MRFHLIKGTIFRCRLSQENGKKSKTFLSNFSVWNSVGLFRFLDQETCCTVSRFLISWLIRLWIRLIWDFLCYFSSTQFVISESWSKLVRLFFFIWHKFQKKDIELRVQENFWHCYWGAQISSDQVVTQWRQWLGCFL